MSCDDQWLICQNFQRRNCEVLNLVKGDQIFTEKSTTGEDSQPEKYFIGTHGEFEVIFLVG